MQTSGSKLKSLQPLIPAQNVDAAITFYNLTLGFEKAYVDASPANLAILYRGDVQIFLAADADASHAKATSLRIAVENIESLYEEYSAKNVIHPNGKLTTKPWGLKEFVILDLNGVCFAFHEAPQPSQPQLLNPLLKTIRLTLAPLEPAHSATLHELYSDPAVMRHWHTAAHASRQETERLLAGYAHCAWTILLEGKPIGLVNCHGLSESKSVGMGYLLAPQAQGKGYAREACEAITQHLFETLNVPVIELWIYDDNEPSIRLAERLRFQRASSFERSGPDGVSRRKTGSYQLRQADWWKGQRPPP